MFIRIFNFLRNCYKNGKEKTQGDFKKILNFVSCH